MTQYAYPVSSGDETDGSWTDNAGATNLYVGIDDAEPLGVGSDSTYISSTDSSASSDICTIHLGETITDPGASASSHIVYFRVKGAAGFGSIPNLTVALVEGATNNTNGTVRATYAAFTPTSSFADGNAGLSGDARFLVLDATESGNISDYNDLQLRFTRAAGGGLSEQVFISQAYMAAPDVPAVTTESRVGDRVKETTTSTGTGTINLAGAVTGYQTFVAGIGTLNMTYYVIEDANGTAWETGIGKVTDASTDTLSRDTIIASSTGSVISLSTGTHTVFCGSPSRTELGDVQIKTTTYTVTQADSTILADSSGGIFTITMPTAAAAYLGLKFLIKKVTDDANIVTISSAATDFEDEDGSGYSSSIKLYSQGDYYGLMCARVSSSDYRWITVDKYLRPHRITIRNSVAQSITGGAFRHVEFQDTDAGSVGCTFSTSTDKITIARPGRYVVAFKLGMGGSNDNGHYVGIAKNQVDSTIDAADIPAELYVLESGGESSTYVSCAATLTLAEGDTLNLLAFVDSTASTLVAVARQYTTITVTEIV